VTATSGSPRSAAESHARENFSPTTLPIEPPMKAKSMTASSHGGPRSRRADHHRVAEPVFISASASRSRVRAQVEEVERILGAELVASSAKEPASASEAIRPRAHREVVAALPQTQRLARARRRGSASDSWGRCSGDSEEDRLVVGLDRDVDLGHFASLDL
jgi:hypothetical protein